MGWSDANLKDEIEPLQDALAKLRSIASPEPSTIQTGFSASRPVLMSIGRSVWRS
jgi:hypothetical protein